MRASFLLKTLFIVPVFLGGALVMPNEKVRRDLFCSNPKACSRSLESNLRELKTNIESKSFRINEGKKARENIRFPYKKAQLTQRQAAAHLLSRFTFGAKPSDIDRAVKMGLEKWFLQQLDGSLPDDSLNRMLDAYSSLQLSNAQVVAEFPGQGKIILKLVAAGIIDKDSIGSTGKKEYKTLIESYMKTKGIRPIKELLEDFESQKILRARYSQNQLKEVLTDFWFNHFNVSFTKETCSYFIPNYERDVIRPHVLGKFKDLLLASAKSPAMLTYLDNFISIGTRSADSTNRALREKKIAAQMAQLNDTARRKIAYLQRMQQPKRSPGLNENYAREVMELHTLGVDGGYTQQDVSQAARVLTGWTIFPMEKDGKGAQFAAQIGKMSPDSLAKAGFIHEKDFIFYPAEHDDREKYVLGRRFPAGGGYQEGVELLEMLAHHVSTATFISQKIAVRFVCDNPPRSLIDKMKTTFLQTDGNIREVLITMCNAPEFWSKQAVRQKIKSPFELAISALRVLDAKIDKPLEINNWITRMGQKIYYYQAPTGFPDKAQYWISTGGLLNRMNFGLALALQRIPGTHIDMLKLNKNHEPESSTAALLEFARLIMPERDVGQTINLLTPMLNDPNLSQKVKHATEQPRANTGTLPSTNKSGMEQTPRNVVFPNVAHLGSSAPKDAKGDNAMLAQVVGILLGSPEFQRR